MGDGEGGLSLALLTEVALPTGREEDYLGEGAVTFMPGVVVEIGKRHGFRVGANVGFLVREEEPAFKELEVGNEVTFGLGMAMPLGESQYTLITELQGSTALAKELGTEEAPLEARGGVRWHSEDRQLTIDFGAGGSLLQGYGAPDARVLAGLRWSPSLPTAPVVVAAVGCPGEDQDGDGIADCCDACPTEPEDKDGIPDVKDKCPLVPEDLDGFEDEDGCPDLDDDKDGIPDTMDKCRLVPEDLDGWDDLDGCPEWDNDNDGFKDPVDECPNAAETFNDFEDEDGCPDGEQLVVVTAERIDIKGLKGKALKEARAKNRRVVFFIAERSDGEQTGTSPTKPEDLRKSEGVDAGKGDTPKADR